MRIDGTAERPVTHRYLYQHEQWIVEQLAGWVRMPGGGPAHLLATAIDAPVVFFGTGLPEDNWHDGDESVSIDVLLAGAATLAAFWRRLP